jgi:hypothetical protein
VELVRPELALHEGLTFVFCSNGAAEADTSAAFVCSRVSFWKIDRRLAPFHPMDVGRPSEGTRKRYRLYGESEQTGTNLALLVRFPLLP